MSKPLRAKLAALVVLFFVGTFAGQIRGVMNTMLGRVDRGAQVVDEFKATVTTIGQTIDGVVGGLRGTTDAVAGQVADLQAKLADGTATPAQVSQLQGLLEKVRAVAARPGASGPAGPSGPPGPPGATSPAPAQPDGTTTSTTAGGTTSTTRPSATTTTTRPRNTTTTRCTAGVGRLVRIGC